MGLDAGSVVDGHMIISAVSIANGESVGFLSDHNSFELQLRTIGN